jgi:excisionase family DNA binding protein
MKRPISVQAAAELLGISQVAVLKRIAKGTLVAKQLSGKGYLVCRESLDGQVVAPEDFASECRKWVSVPQACDIVCVTDGMIGRMLVDGRLDGFRLNNKAWAVSRASCEKNIEEYLAGPKPIGRPRVISASHAPKKKTKSHRRKTA